MYVFKAKTRKSLPQKPYIKSRVRAIWGKVTRLHGSTGSVRARFRKNLPGHAMGQAIRVVSIHPNQHKFPNKFMCYAVKYWLEPMPNKQSQMRIKMMIAIICRHLKPEYQMWKFLKRLTWFSYHLLAFMNFGWIF